MDDLDLEHQDSQPDGGSVTPEEQDLQPEPEAQPDIATLQQKNKELYARAKKAEEENKALKAKSTPQPEPKAEPTNPSPEKLDRIELRVDGYSDEEIGYLLPLGGKKALANPIVQKAVEAMRAEKKSKDATPEGGQASPVFKKHTLTDLQNMPLDQLEKILPHAQ